MHPRIPQEDPLQLCHDWLHSNLESYRMLYEEPSFGPTEKHGRWSSFTLDVYVIKNGDEGIKWFQPRISNFFVSGIHHDPTVNKDEKQEKSSHNYIWVLNATKPTTCVCVSVFENWVVPEKIHTPPTDGILEILVGGGGQRPWKSRRERGLNSKKSAAGVISTDSSRDSNVLIVRWQFSALRLRK